MVKAIVSGAIRAVETVRRVLGGKAARQSFLLLRYSNALGVCVHDSTMEEALRRANPDCEIIVASAGAAAELARYSPFVDYVIKTADPFRDPRSAAMQLRAGLKKSNLRPTAVLTSLGNQRSSLVIAAAVATPARRYGYTQLPGCYQTALPHDLTATHIANNLRITHLFGGQDNALEPAVFFNEDSLAQARTLLSEGRGPLVAMVVETSRGQKTNWHMEHFRDVANAVIAQGCTPVFLGTQQNIESIEGLRAGLQPGSISLAGQTDIPTLAAVLALCDYCISLDTGTMHVARSVDLPLVALGPCWQKPTEWLPIAKANARILRGADCDQVPENYLLDEISVPQVLDAFDDLRAKYPPSAQAKEARIAARLSHVGPVFV